MADLRVVARDVPPRAKISLFSCSFREKLVRWHAGALPLGLSPPPLGNPEFTTVRASDMNTCHFWYVWQAKTQYFPVFPHICRKDFLSTKSLKSGIASNCQECYVYCLAQYYFLYSTNRFYVFGEKLSLCLCCLMDDEKDLICLIFVCIFLEIPIN